MREKSTWKDTGSRLRTTSSRDNPTMYMEARVTRESSPRQRLRVLYAWQARHAVRCYSVCIVADDASGSSVIQFLTHITISRHTTTRSVDSVILHIGPTTSSIW